MGIFDTFSGRVTCAHCGELNHADVQFKGLDPSMHTFEIGDYVDGKEPFCVFSVDYEDCRYCEKTFKIYALGKMGYLYGFCNELEFAQIKLHIPLNEPVGFVHVAFSKDWLDRDPEAVWKQFKEAYAKNPNETNFVFAQDDVDGKLLEQWVCRVPSFVANPAKRPDVGEVWYIDNRESRFDYWEMKDQPATVTARVFNERTQDFSYSLVLADGSVLEDIQEATLVKEEKRAEILHSLQQAEEEILSFLASKKNAQTLQDKKVLRVRAFSMSQKYGSLVDHLKKAGKLPADFSIE